MSYILIKLHVTVCTRYILVLLTLSMMYKSITNKDNIGKNYQEGAKDVENSDILILISLSNLFSVCLSISLNFFIKEY